MPRASVASIAAISGKMKGIQAARLLVIYAETLEKNAPQADVVLRLSVIDDAKRPKKRKK